MQLAAIVESLIVASEEPVSAEEIARLIRSRVAEAEDARARDLEEGQEVAELPSWLASLAAVSGDDIAQVISDLNGQYEASGRAFALVERAKGWKLYTRAEFAEFVRQMFPGRKPERLSAPAMETLAIIAYRQPVTKAAIEAVRGVACDGMIQKLLDRDLIRIGGRADLPGRPLLYETTELFFEHFGIRSIDDLPNSGELRKVKLPEPEAAADGADRVEQQLVLSAAGRDGAGQADEAGPEQPDAENPES